MITVSGISSPPMRLIWETDLRAIGMIELTYPGDVKLDLSPGGPLPEVAWGEPGRRQKLMGYTVYRVESKERVTVVAHEFGGAWRTRTHALHTGTRDVAIKTLLAAHREKAGRIEARGGQSIYAQHESDVAFLYRLAAEKSVWRDVSGAVNICDPPETQVEEVLEYIPATGPTRRYVAAGITPGGEAFEVAAGDGSIVVRVDEVFYSPAEARDCIERLSRTEVRGRLIAAGVPGLRAGCTVILPGGKRHLVVRAVHEVMERAWRITCYLA